MTAPILRLCDVTVTDLDDVTVTGLAQCLREACGWETTEPVPLKILSLDMGRHTREAGHTEFVRFAADHVTVTLAHREE
ncbi:hypothetical protein [Kitasatospora sp. NPDC101183]|uniref:hypothetical protein n=1 Tax=Kitasatospora sp. NPDC101183 TaxID=3364100 RepID=UPI0038222361